MAVDLPDLPLPGASVLEVMFRRMLLQCQQRIAAHDAGLQSDWRGDPRFHCLLDVLQEKLYDLEHTASDKLSPDVLQLYKTHVKAILAELRQPDVPAYCLRVTAQDRAVDNNSESTAAAVGGNRVAGVNAADSSTAVQLLNASRAITQHNAARDAAESNHSSTQPRNSSKAAEQSEQASFSLSSSAKEKIQTQQRLQDELTGELLEMGQELKASTLAMQSAIRYRGKLLDDAEVALVHSTVNAQSVAGKAKQQYRQASWGLCRVMMMLLVVAAVFSFMIVWIRLTSMVGLKGR